MNKIIGLVLCLALAFGLTGCGMNKSSESFDKKIAVSDVYTEIEGDCNCFYANQDDVLAMLEHGTGIVFFTWSDCPWCHKMIQFVNEYAVKSGIDVMCYDIYKDRDKNTKFYQSVIELLSDELSGVEAYDEYGKLRIYVPDVVFVAAGEIIGHTNETSMISGHWDDIDAAINDYWTTVSENGKTNEENIKAQINEWCCEVCKKIEEIEGRGCQACPVTRK